MEKCFGLNLKNVWTEILVKKPIKLTIYVSSNTTNTYDTYNCIVRFISTYDTYQRYNTLFTWYDTYCIAYDIDNFAYRTFVIHPSIVGVVQPYHGCTDNCARQVKRRQSKLVEHWIWSNCGYMLDSHICPHRRCPHQRVFMVHHHHQFLLPWSKYILHNYCAIIRCIMPQSFYRLSFT